MKQVDISTPKHPGVFALVDDDDYERVAQYKWSVEVRKNVRYATRSVLVSRGKWKTVRLHQFVLGTLPGEQVDHKDGDGLNNQKNNLRLCSHSQNCANTSKSAPTECYSKFKGVSWCKRFRCWVAVVRIGKKQTKLGNFDSELAAAAHYDEAAIGEFGEFARPNGIAMTDELRAQKRPFRRGENSSAAKITECEVRAIRTMDAPQQEIADMFGITQTAVSQIKLRKTWKHVD